MSQPAHHLNYKDFLSQLTLMFHHARDSGTVTWCIKRYDGRTVPLPKTRKRKGRVVRQAAALPEPQQYNCLIRARFRSQAISTVAPANMLPEIQKKFLHLLHISIDGLEKEKKASKKNTKSKVTN